MRERVVTEHANEQESSVPFTGDTLESIISIRELKRLAILHALAVAGGNKRIAAKHLGIALKTLYDNMNSFGIALTRRQPQTQRRKRA